MLTDAERKARLEAATPNDPIPAFSRDRQRILASDVFRRLGGVTQVTTDLGESQLLYNRLTHSLRVGQIGRMITEGLVRNWPHENLAPPNADVVEAAGLAHDLGHPPFGHIGEQALDQLALEENLDGYEGNAQTFRIVTKLATNTQGSHGLNLTRATLNAVLKYPWFRRADGLAARKWSSYQSESAYFEFARLGYEDDLPSVEAQIMDWADDIAYSSHDFFDFYRAGMLDASALSGGNRRALLELLEAASKKLDKVPEEGWLESFLETFFYGFPGRYEGRPTERQALHQLLSRLTSTFMEAVAVSGDGQLDVSAEVASAVALLKAVTITQVIQRPQLTLNQEGQRRTLIELYAALQEWSSKHTVSNYPPLLQEMFEASESEQRAYSAKLVKARALIDYIAMLTDREAAHLLERLTGRYFHSLGGWLR
ncbi:deoxyguanosinetriphosphate triphosphohydrolase family protein [Blastococcus deserti]|uniref:Deoxyguanosinetriphosphate triphosphohydrolase family protein n=1 Tax=Blastococcus deserti TaxID=2259033 RepID=A0ABW4XDQ8_9ACTN